MEARVIPSQDAIVVGAGPAGSACACFLARGGAAVTLIDKSDFPRDKICGDGLSPRALEVARALGAFEAIEARAHVARAIRFHAPDGSTSSGRFPAGGSSRREAMVLPRYTLDAILVERAIAAGADFAVASVDSLLIESGKVRGVRLEGGVALRATNVVLATGAGLPLVREAGLVSKKPVRLVASRRYYEGLSGLDGPLDFHFDGVDLPGYAWVFPTGPSSANVGLGWLGPRRGSPSHALERLAAGANPLARRLRDSKPVSPARSYPLRVDYLKSKPAAPGVLAIGEAAGLVNPITGEGIDYALESGGMAAAAILGARGDEGAARPVYERELRARFRTLFRVMHIAERLYYNSFGLNRLVGANPLRQRLVDLLIEVCFGIGDPKRLLAPRTLFDMVRP